MTSYAVTSEIFTAATIMQVVVRAADLGDWSPEPGTTMMRREGTVTVALSAVLKGSLTEAVGDTVDVEIVQRSTGGPRIGDFYGLWSHVPTDAGARLVALSDGEASSLAQALTEEHCLRLIESGPVFADLRLSVGLQSRHLTADQLLEEAQRQRARGSRTFARYVWVAAREALRASADRFDRLMRVAEDGRTRIEAQEAYLVAAYEDITFSGEFPDTHRARLARAMLRSALDPRLGELRTHLLGTFLPNLVNAPIPEPMPPDAVFAAAPDLPDGEALRREVLTELDDPRDPATTSPALRGWLDQPAAAPQDREG